MKRKFVKRRAALIAAVGGVLSLWAARALLEASCQPLALGVLSTIEVEGTSTLVALAIVPVLFILFFVILAKDSIEKFDKVVVLALSALAVAWIAYVLLDDKICSPSAWRNYVAFLVVPSLLGSIALVGRDWLRSND